MRRTETVLNDWNNHLFKKIFILKDLLLQRYATVSTFVMVCVYGGLRFSFAVGSGTCPLIVRVCCRCIVALVVGVLWASVSGQKNCVMEWLFALSRFWARCMPTLTKDVVVLIHCCSSLVVMFIVVSMGWSSMRLSMASSLCFCS